jgi:hypothetical protein
MGIAAALLYAFASFILLCWIANQISLRKEFPENKNPNAKLTIIGKYWGGPTNSTGPR